MHSNSKVEIESLGIDVEFWIEKVTFHIHEYVP